MPFCLAFELTAVEPLSDHYNDAQHKPHRKRQTEGSPGREQGKHGRNNHVRGSVPLSNSCPVREWSVTGVANQL
ncbi:hypothetical protein ATF69_0550 [Acidovorax delafieldii]|uniref:Uncharacterized protein n=1 Tax=Acidovorax delafieldii TaxID=47920 RepID=A0A561XRE9_ACIDE|nr:hypothetical protein ATF69_0550 [Acidovorax delafieldii]